MHFIMMPHLGLGDHLIMNGYVHHILETENPDSIIIVAFDNYQRKTLEHLYVDYPRVSFFWIPYPDNEAHHHPICLFLTGWPFRTKVFINSMEYIVLNFGIYSIYRSPTIENNSWADSFYIQGHVDPSFRFKKFKLPSNMSGSELLYKRVIDKIGKDYIIITDDIIRKRIMSVPLLKYILKQSNELATPVIYLGIKRYEQPLFEGLNNADIGKEVECASIFDLWKLIQNAKQCHLMDSSLTCMADQMTDSTSSLYLHAYMTDTKDDKITIFVNRKWTILL